MKISKTLRHLLLACGSFLAGRAAAAVSRSTLNCKYRLLPEYIDAIGSGSPEMYLSEIRGIQHQAENRVLLNIRYESVVTISLERSFDSDLDFSYLQVVGTGGKDFRAEGNLTWGVAGNNTRLFLRTMLEPSRYVIVIGSNFAKNEDEQEKTDNPFCSPISFEFGLTTLEILSSLRSLSLNDPFNKPLVNLSADEKYQFSNQVGDSFVVRTIPQGVNLSSKLYKGTILWSKLFVIPHSKSSEKLINLYIELGFKFPRTPLSLLVEPLRVDQAQRESKDPLNYGKLHSRVFFGTPIYNGQLFKESIALKSFRIVVVAPWMSHIPPFATFDLKISISFQSYSSKLPDELLPYQNECNLPKLPTKVVQDGLSSLEVQEITKPESVSSTHYYFGPKVNIQGPFESLTSHPNHLIHLQISKPSSIYLLSHHDHSDIAITLSSSPTISEEEEDLEFYLDFEDEEGSSALGMGSKTRKNEHLVCNTRNLNHLGVTSKEANLLFCEITHPGDYYLHIHNFRISESQNAVSLCTPFHLQLEIFPLSPRTSLCENPTRAEDFRIPISSGPGFQPKEYQISQDLSRFPEVLAEPGVLKLHSQEFQVEDLRPARLSVQLRLPEHPGSLVLLNIIFRDQIWMTLTPHSLHEFFASAGPLVAGKYVIQLFALLPENLQTPMKTACLRFGLDVSLVRLSSTPESSANFQTRIDAEEEDHISRCQMSQMKLPTELDLTSYSDGEEYILDGTFLVPLEEYVPERSSRDSGPEAQILQDFSASHIISVRLPTQSVLKASITNYPGMVLIHIKKGKKVEVGSNHVDSVFELEKGVHDLILEFDILEDGVDEQLQEGGCPTFRLHLSITSAESLPVFPPLLFPDLFGVPLKRSGLKSRDGSGWSHSELLSISKSYIEHIFPHDYFTSDLPGNLEPVARDSAKANTKFLINKGNSLEIREIAFWFSPVMTVSIPLKIDVEEVSLDLVLETYPSWLPVFPRIFEGSGVGTSQNAKSPQIRFARIHHSGNKVEYTFPGIPKGEYHLMIQSDRKISKPRMGRSVLLKISGVIRPVLRTRLFSLRQELLAIPDILPFQELPDSLNRLRFLSEPQQGVVTTIMFGFREIRKTTLEVPEGETYLLRLLSEPTLISGYEFYVAIVKTKQDNQIINDRVVFNSGKYGDTLTLLSSGEYQILFSPVPSSMPYLVTIGLIKFNPSEYEGFFRKVLSFSKGSQEVLHEYAKESGGVGAVRSLRSPRDATAGKELFGAKRVCHHYLENFKVTLNEKNAPYYNSGVVNVCQGGILNKNRLSTFSSNIYDIELTVPTSSIVYLQVSSDFLYSFFRIGIVVPEGFWVAEQRGSQSYLEVELTKGVYLLRIESLNSFLSFEEHEMLLFSMQVEISPIDGSEAALDSSSVTDNSVDPFEEYKKLVQDSGNSKCHIPNGVPLPLDLTSIQGGSTVFGGPMDASRPMFLFRSRITLTDIHNGRKKVFLELPKKSLPTFLRLSVSPVNFDISDSPNMLEVLLTKINSSPIQPIYTNSDSLLNSVEKVFKVDLDTIQVEHRGATNIPFWLSFSHKFDSFSNRLPCLAFDIVFHLVSPDSQEVRFSDPPPLSSGADSWFKEFQNKLNRALSVKKFPQYIHFPPTNSVISLDSQELETDILIDLNSVSPGQILLIADLYYNPLLVSSKLALYSESDPNKNSYDEKEDANSLPDISLLKSSALQFHGNVTSPLYAKERISAVLTPNSHLLECSIRILPPFNLKKVPIMLGLSLIPISHDLPGTSPLIVAISPDPSVPILSGQNLHLTIRFSSPLRDKKSPSALSKSIFIAGSSESKPENRVFPFHLQVLDAGHTLSISYNYQEIIKVSSEKQDSFSKRGFLVLDTSKLLPKDSKSSFKAAPWIPVFLESGNQLLVEISSNKPNSLGWGSMVWNGDWNEGFSKPSSTQKTQNLRNKNLLEMSSIVVYKLSSPLRESKEDSPHAESAPGIVNARTEATQYTPKAYEEAASEKTHSTLWVLLPFLALCALVIYLSPIYRFLSHLGTYVVSRLSALTRNKKEYNLIGERNDFDFLNNMVSEDEEENHEEERYQLERESAYSPKDRSLTRKGGSGSRPLQSSSPVRDRKSGIASSSPVYSKKTE
ncbi:putative transmembrane protein [Cryptosporidium felis]|nr:putative transmembrane protein [Cryptosporidium felis]